MTLGLLTDKYIVASQPPAISGEVNALGDTFTRLNEEPYPAEVNIDLPAKASLKDSWYTEFMLDFELSSVEIRFLEDAIPSSPIVFSLLLRKHNSVSEPNFNINAGAFIDVEITDSEQTRVVQNVYIDNETPIGIGFSFLTGLGDIFVGSRNMTFQLDKDLTQAYVYTQIAPLTPPETPTGVLPVLFFNNGENGFKLNKQAQPWSDEFYSKDVERIKAILGDNDPLNPYISDQDYALFLEEANGNVLLGSLYAARAIRGRFSTAIDEEVGREKVKFSQLFSQFNDLIKDLEKQVSKSALGGSGIYAGGISNADMIANDRNRDNRRPRIGQGVSEDMYPNNKWRRTFETQIEDQEL